jgi:methionyl-tRNA formyltransferase
LSSTHLKIAYAGSADFSLNILSALWVSGFLLTDIFTQPDKPIGRGRVLKPTSVKLFSEEKKLSCHTFNKLSFEVQPQILELDRPDFFIIVAYGLMIPNWLLEWPKVACINIHASILPQWRGASPIQSAILNNDKYSGITLIRLNNKMDEGNIIDKASIAIDQFNSSEELSRALSAIGAKMICDNLKDYKNINWIGEPQVHKYATYCKKIKKEDGQINWNLKSIDIHNMIRGFNPWPIAFTKLQDGRTMRVWESEMVDQTPQCSPGTILELSKDSFIVACGEGVLKIIKLQIQGGKVILARDFYNSAKSGVSFATS